MPDGREHRVLVDHLSVLDPLETWIEPLQQKRKQLFPNSTTIASLTGQQQMTLIRTIEASNFFELLRTHTVLGFLGNPSYGGNRGEIGWNQIGFEDRMAYQPPFGYYDAQVNGEKK